MKVVPGTMYYITEEFRLTVNIHKINGRPLNKRSIDEYDPLDNLLC